MSNKEAENKIIEFIAGGARFDNMLISWFAFVGLFFLTVAIRYLTK